MRVEIEGSNIQDILDSLKDIHILFVYSKDDTGDTGIIISSIVRSETTGYTHFALCLGVL